MTLCGTCDTRQVAHPKTGNCHPCYMRVYWAKKRDTLGSGRAKRDDQWFDWVAVNRAWNRWQGNAGWPVGRRLSSAEKLHLLYHAVAQGRTAPTDLRWLIGGEYNATKTLVDQLMSGAVTVYERDEVGRALGPMPPL